MKRIPRDPEKFEVIDLFNAIGQKRGLKLTDKNSEKAFIESISSSLRCNKEIPILLHGHRVQTMFGYVASSLKECVVIKQEDSGETYIADSKLRPPDYRLVLKEGSEFFVEVKNCHKENPSYKYSIKKSYYDALRNYTELFGKELKIAIYWSKWNFWSLVSANKMKNQDTRYTITFHESVKINEMGTLGDKWIGTKPPLTLRVIADPKKPRTIDKEGNVTFSIAGIELFCHGTLIEDVHERNLAVYLMLYGDWSSTDPRAILVNNQLTGIEYLIEPYKVNEEQGFDFIGRLSGMISRQFNDLTAANGKIDRLSPDVEPEILGISISKNYKGKYLPLWRFTLTPNYKVNRGHSEEGSSLRLTLACDKGLIIKFIHKILR